MVRPEPPLGKRRPLHKGRGDVVREELVVERRGEGDFAIIAREALDVSQRKFQERRARVGRLEDQRAAAAAQAAARIVERAPKVVEEQLAVLQEIEAEAGRAPPPRRHGRRATWPGCRQSDQGLGSIGQRRCRVDQS